MPERNSALQKSDDGNRNAGAISSVAFNRVAHRGTKGVAMPLTVYPDFGWFIRAARILPVAAIAALAGGALGGYIAFTINGALLPPPHPDVRANGEASVAVVRAKPVTIVGGATLDPVAPTQTQIQTPSAPLLATPLATTAPVVPENAPPPTRWPNALLRAHEKVTPPALQPSAPPAPGAGEEVKSAETDRKSSGNAVASVESDRAAARRHARVARKREMQFSATAGARQAGDRAYNRVYDYYGATGEQRFGSDERYGARRRTIGRGQRPEWTQPTEGAQPWSGQSWGGGGGFYRGWQ
jgi:hypothetical protein